MANGGKTVAIGAAAAAAVIGGKELLVSAPKFAAHTTTHFTEISASKIGVVAEGVGGGFGNGANGIRSNSGKLATSEGFGTAQTNFDISGSLATTMRVGKLAEAEANPFPSFDSSALLSNGEKFDAISKAPVVTSRPIVLFPNQDFNFSGVSSYFSNAQPKLANDLTALTPPLLKATVQGIVEADLKNVAENAAKNSDSKVTFEAFSGKLKIESSTTVAGMKVTGGEVNVYTVAGAITGGVMACNALTDATFKNCVDAAIKTAVSSFVKDSKVRGAGMNAD
jgi:hypothetical protein